MAGRRGASAGEIEFSEAEKAALAARLQRWCRDELDVELEQFPARFLLDFVTGELGPHFYNRALLDAEAVIETRMDALRDALHEIEKPVLDPERR